MVTMVALVSKAQKIRDKDVPKKVMVAFQKNFGSAKVKKWEKEGSNFVVELSQMAKSNLYDMQGTLLKTEIKGMDLIFNKNGEFIKEIKT